MNTPRSVLIAGGYGAFGTRAAARLARTPDVAIVIAGRDGARARAAADALQARDDPGGRRRIIGVALDAARVTGAELQELGCAIVLNASGPFQHAQPSLARACINAGCHYVDLADDRAFVSGISALDAAARAADVLIVSGASTVPAVSGAVIDRLRPQFKALTSLTYGVSPGNSFDPGLATVQSILSYVGRPFPMLIAGRSTTVYGWQGLRRQRFGTLGNRWLGACDIPDLALFPVRYPDLKTVRFGAGVEVPLFHFAMQALSWLVRGGMLRAPGALARPLLAMKRALSFLGTDAGGMAMTLEGPGLDGQPKRIDWSLVARAGNGPNIPPTPALIVIGKLLDGTLATRGAMPCLGLVTLDEIEAALADLAMEFATA